MGCQVIAGHKHPYTQTQEGQLRETCRPKPNIRKTLKHATVTSGCCLVRSLEEVKTWTYCGSPCERIGIHCTKVLQYSGGSGGCRKQTESWTVGWAISHCSAVPALFVFSSSSPETCLSALTLCSNGDPQTNSKHVFFLPPRRNFTNWLQPHLMKSSRCIGSKPRPALRSQAWRAIRTRQHAARRWHRIGALREAPLDSPSAYVRSGRLVFGEARCPCLCCSLHTETHSVEKEIMNRCVKHMISCIVGQHETRF